MRIPVAFLVLAVLFFPVVSVAEVSLSRQKIEEATLESEVQTGVKLEPLAYAIIKLQPWYKTRPLKADEIAYSIERASKQYNHNPFIALAIARRESSLMPTAGNKRGIGYGIDRGLFQIRSGGVAERYCGYCDQFNYDCSARTALCWLDKTREMCGDSPWQFVAGYGRNECPRDLGHAKTWREVKLARSFLCKVSEKLCNEVWPE
jgi:hypothetical protein